MIRECTSGKFIRKFFSLDPRPTKRKSNRDYSSGGEPCTYEGYIGNSRLLKPDRTKVAEMKEKKGELEESTTRMRSTRKRDRDKIERKINRDRLTLDEVNLSNRYH